MITDVYKRQVREVMSKHVVSVYPTDTVHEALDLLVENRVSVLPVVNGERQCLGILSSTDLIDLARDTDDELAHLEEVDGANQRWLIQKLSHTFGQEPIQDFMTEDVASVTPETTLGVATREMLRHRVHHLPVVRNDNRLVGIVSTMDILAAFVEHASD